MLEFIDKYFNTIPIIIWFVVSVIMVIANGDDK